MSWLFGLWKKRTGHLAPSQMGTGTPGDTTWLDDIRQERANLDEKRKAAAAKEAKEERWRLTYRVNSFVQMVKAGLPRGVEIVDVFNDPTPYEYEDKWAPQPSRDHPVVRIDLGVGVRFDLRLVPMWVSHGDGPSERTDQIIQTYEAESPYTKENVLGEWRTDPGAATPQKRMSEHLFDALEVYNARHRGG